MKQREPDKANLRARGRTCVPARCAEGGPWRTDDSLRLQAAQGPLLPNGLVEQFTKLAILAG